MSAVPESVAVSGIVAALERAWAAVRVRHPDVPDVALIVASGMKRGNLECWGHYWHARWSRAGDASRRPEVMISGEGLNRPPAEVLGTLIHEAVHGAAKARNIEDTSRQGRWHNGKFAVLAEAMGLRAIRHKTIGHVTEIRPGTVTDYADVLADLASALVLYRVNETRWVRPRAPRPRAPEPDIGIDGPMAPRPILPSPGIEDDERADLADETGGATLTVTLVPVDTKNGLVGMCGCGRKLRGSVSAWKGGAVLCATCNQPFQITGPET